MASFLRVLLLALYCVVVVPGGSGLPQIDNKLAVTVDDHTREIYLDGSPITLTNPSTWDGPYIIPLPDSTRVIAVLGENLGDAAGMVASDLGGWVLSDRHWKYSIDYFPNWMKVGFNDSAWKKSFIARERNDGRLWHRFPGVSRDASLIWSPKFHTGNFTTNENKLYFRLKIERDVLRRNFDWVSSDKMMPKSDCFRSRRIRCASSCSQMTSLCAGFQHHKDTDTCCLLTVADLQSGVRKDATGWKIWSSIVLNE